MTTEPKLRPINSCVFYPENLTAEIENFNADVQRIETERAALTTEAGALRRAALSGKIEKPDRLSADAAKLTARRVGLDIEEIQLIARKAEFQEPILTAHRTERDRLASLEKDRRAEITDGLTKLGANITRCNEILNTDARVRELALARSIVSDFKKVTSEEDEQRLTVLQSRVSAAVPIL
jgi:hypothetical protein